MSTAPCPTPGKRAYRRHIDAKIALASTQRGHKPCREEQRAYHCRCGAWHLTSRPDRRRR